MHKKLTYSAICVALSIVLSFVKLFHMPYGGSVTACSMFFITLIGYWFGPAAGIAGGVADGLIQLLVDGYVVHPVQLLLDYPIAFGALGIAGLFRKGKYGLYTGYLAGVSARFICSFISGLVFFRSTFPEGMNAVAYSAGYNFSYMLPEAIITVIVISIPSFKTAIMRVKEEMNSSHVNEQV